MFFETCITSKKIVFYDKFVLFWMHHSKHLRQLGCIIPNIQVTLDISYYFEQCHKRPCFLLVHEDVAFGFELVARIVCICNLIFMQGLGFQYHLGLKDL